MDAVSKALSFEEDQEVSLKSFSWLRIILFRTLIVFLKFFCNFSVHLFDPLPFLQRFRGQFYRILHSSEDPLDVERHYSPAKRNLSSVRSLCSSLCILKSLCSGPFLIQLHI